MHIQKIFEVLNTPADLRLKTLDEQLRLFPYVNVGLFKETLPIADFTSAMREKLIQCCSLDWSKISPAIFGAMFQSVMNPDERHSLGAHYTSEENILKLIHPLFLDELWKEFLNKDSDKKLFLYEDIKGVPKEVPAKQINAYLMRADFTGTLRIRPTFFPRWWNLQFKDYKNSIPPLKNYVLPCLKTAVLMKYGRYRLKLLKILSLIFLIILKPLS